MRCVRADCDVADKHAKHKDYELPPMYGLLGLVQIHDDRWLDPNDADEAIDPQPVNEVATVAICEGESDCDAGYATAPNNWFFTTNDAGGSSWKPEHAEWLRGHRGYVVVMIDFDATGVTGWKRARKVLTSLLAVGISRDRISFKLPRRGKDLRDHLNAGHNVHDLIDVPEVALHQDARKWMPAAQILRRTLPEAGDDAFEDVGVGRNQLGHTVACQLRDARATRDQAEALIRVYLERCEDDPNPTNKYEWRDVVATLGQVYDPNAPSPRDPNYGRFDTFDPDTTPLSPMMEKALAAVRAAMGRVDSGEFDPADDMPTPAELAKLPQKPELVEDLFTAHGFSLLGGRRGSGKTVLATALAEGVRRGTQFLGQKVLSQGTVIFYQGESRDHQMDPKIQAYAHRYGEIPDDADEQLLVRFPGDRPDLTEEQHVARVVMRAWTAVKESGQPMALVVFDPILKYHTGPEKDSEVMAKVADALQAIADILDCHVLVLQHTNKQGEITGSLRLEDFAQSVLVARQLAHSVALRHTKRRGAYSGVEVRFHNAPNSREGWLEEIDPLMPLHEFDEMLKERKTDAPPSGRVKVKMSDPDNLRPAIVKFLKRNLGASQNALAEGVQGETGVGHNDVRKELKVMIEDGVVRREKKGRGFAHHLTEDDEE